MKSSKIPLLTWC